METTPVHLLPDFAVAVQLNPPVSPWSIDRLYNAPLTISSPAVIVCVQAQNAHMESESLSEDELVDLRNLMAPHLRATSMGVGKQECGDWPSWATLFTLYIKAGILHLMACTLRWDEKKAQTDIYLVDSIPIRAVVTSPEDTQNRLRLAIALLTLRSHVYRFFERWSEIEWEESLLSGERVALNIVTGMESRLGSSGGSVREERSQQELDDIIGQFIEAVGGMATDLEEGSLETETTIVDSEGYRVIKERIDSWEDKGHDELSC